MSSGSAIPRKPPEPTDSHGDIEKWIKDVMPRLQPIVTRLDALIRETHSGLQFAVKWKKAHYGLPKRGWIIELVAYDISVNVVFYAGADFKSPPPHATTARTRYVKVKSMEEVESPEMRAWIKEAGSLDGWR